jgi:hypothetical protein
VDVKNKRTSLQKSKTKASEGVDPEELALSYANRPAGDPAARMPTEPAPAVPPGFPYVITVAWSARDYCYVGRVNALDVVAHESTPAEAARQAHSEGELALEERTARGEPLPPADLPHPADARGRLGALRSPPVPTFDLDALKPNKKKP